MKGKITLKQKRKGTEGLPTDTILWDDIESERDDSWQKFMRNLYPELEITTQTNDEEELQDT